MNLFLIWSLGVLEAELLPLTIAGEQALCRLPTPVFLDFSGGSGSEESACNAGDLGLIPGLGRSPGGGYGTHSSILS